MSTKLCPRALTRLCKYVYIYILCLALEEVLEVPVETQHVLVLQCALDLDLAFHLHATSMYSTFNTQWGGR